MARPSRNLDRALLAAGRALLPEVGCAGLTIRQVAEAAGVNIGMFHYHFKTREAFLRAVMQSAYEEMFASFTLEHAHPKGSTNAEHLRALFRVLGRFLRDNRKFMGRILSDAVGGEPCAREFLRDNLPRHAKVLAMLIGAGQAAGEFRRMPVPQALGFCAGALASPILLGGAIADSGQLPEGLATQLGTALLTDAAIDQRIDLALAAIAAPGPSPGIAKRAPSPGTSRRAPRKKKGS